MINLDNLLDKYCAYSLNNGLKINFFKYLFKTCEYAIRVSLIRD